MMFLRTLLIGRSKSADIVLTDDTVSRKHAEFHITSAREGVVEDLGATSGTYMRDGQNWQRIYRAEVRTGDLLRFGAHELAVSEILAQAGPLPEKPRETDQPDARRKFARDPLTGEIRRT